MLRVLAVLVVAALCGSATAQERTLLASSGAWKLFSGEYPFMAEEGWVKMSPTCYAMTGNDKAVFAFAALPHATREAAPEFFGIIYLQIGAEAFNFRKRTADLSVGDGHYNLTIVGAFYDEDFVMVNMGGNGQAPWEFEVAARTWSDRIIVTDERDRRLATFPATGLKEIYPRFMRCAGLKLVDPW